MRSSWLLAFVGFVATAWAAPPKPGGDPEPPDAQARAVAALKHARVVALQFPAPKTIAGIGRGTQASSKAIQGKVTGLDAALKDLNAQVLGQEIHIELPADVLFDFDKADIRPDSSAALAKVAVVVRAYSGATVRVDGHTDSKGSDAYNLKLSERRAQSVVAWLQTREGLSGVAFAVRGLGESQPVAHNTNPDGSDNPEGRQKNRRVEIVVRK
jgi:outer membrane protein OmpA-like peptidoglycan-associated protein